MAPMTDDCVVKRAIGRKDPVGSGWPSGRTEGEGVLSIECIKDDANIRHFRFSVLTIVLPDAARPS